MLYDLTADLTPIRVIASYRLLTSPVGIVTRQKRRQCWGVLLKAEGKTIYTQNGINVLSDRSHIVLLPKGSAYEWTCTEPGECIVIDFDALEEGESIRPVEVNDNTAFLNAFSKIERSLSIENPVGRLEAMQQLYGLLAFLSKSANKQYMSKDKRKALSPAVEYITASYSDPEISNEKLALLCGMSTVYFRKCFQSVYGCSPIRYLNRLRIHKAKAILTGDFESISQVAESIGYCSVYHFSKMFKQYTGQSPTEFAKNRTYNKIPD